jgi:hypothetical protein
MKATCKPKQRHCRSTDSDNLLRSLITWSEGQQRKSCAARLLDASDSDADFFVFGNPPVGTNVRITFSARSRAVPGTVVQFRSGSEPEGPHSARVTVCMKGWRDFLTGIGAEGSPCSQFAAAGRRATAERPRQSRGGVADVTTTAEQEFHRAMEDYKHASGRMFPTWSEVLEVLKNLGYQKNG